MSNKEKSGRSIILLVIVIVVTSFAMFFVIRLFTNVGLNDVEEEAFKLNVYEYYLEIEDYKAQMSISDEDLNVCGVELQTVIPDIIETDMPKFKIEDGKLVYIGNNEQEKQWTSELKI